MRMRHPWSKAVLLFPLLGASALESLGQESEARFDAPVVVADENHRMTAFLDCDGDGFMDAAGWWPSATNSFRISAWKNDGSGEFLLTWDGVVTSSGPITLQDLAAGDFDGDGLDDLVFATGALGHVVYYYLSDGAGGFAFSYPWWTSEPYAVTDLLAADFDLDGRSDLARTNAAGYLQITLSLPGGPSLSPASIPLPALGSHVLFRADVDGNSVPDLGVAIFGTSTTLALFPVVAGAPTPGPVFALPGVADPMPVSGDVDGDGDEDIVVFEMTQYWVLRRTGATGFALESPVPGGPATDLVDVDGDGDLDGVCCGGGGGGGGGGGVPLPPNVLPSIFRVSLNQGGTFAPAFEIPGLGAQHIAGATDVDADGDVDLVAGRCVYYSHGPLAAPPHVPTGVAAPIETAIADLDRDGDPDLEVGLGAVQRNAADGTFAPFIPVLPPAPAGTTFEEPSLAGDFDGDGDADLVVEHRAGATLLSMRLLRNNGGGGFVDGGDAVASGALPAPPASPMNPLAADADGDGDVDLFLTPAAFSVPPQPTWLLINDGTGAFTPAPLIPEVVKDVRDFTGDGLPDLLAAAVGLTLRPGLGNGTFGPAVATFGPITDAFRDRPAVADFDDDGDFDVVRAWGDSAFLYSNNGGGTFTNSWVWLGHLSPAPTLPRRVFAPDVNADGLPDVVLSPALFAENASWVYLNDPAFPGSFVVPGTKQVFGAKALADVDGDGDDDVVSAWVVRNRRFEGLIAGSKRQYGAGLAGSGGMIPTLGEVGPFRSGQPCELRVTGALGGTLGILAMGDQPIDVPAFGGSLLVNPVYFWTFLASGPFGEPGAGSYVFPWTADPAWSGITFYKQAGFVDPAAPYWISISNAIRVTIGQ